MSTIDERNVDPIQEMTRIAQSSLDLESWRFKVSFRASKSGKLIYDSEWCRLSMIWGGWDYGGGNSISIFYGRLHAPDEKSTMVWNGEECYCWHRFELALHFLDGQTPQNASTTIYTHGLIEQYKQSESAQSLTANRRQPEWLARKHATIWQHYGSRLFEVFDLRRPDVWEEYRQFLKEVYDVKGRSPNIEPPPDKVC